jgi:glucose-6-phosphate 1-dehydrogenase
VSVETAKAPPHLFVVVGATGDLMWRKLLPALYQLARQGKFPETSRILGVARKDLDEPGFRAAAVTALLAEKVGAEPDVRAFCDAKLLYHRLTGETAEDYHALQSRIQAIDAERGLEGNRVLYLALPLDAMAPTIQGLGEAGLNTSPGWTRLVVEKPFGRDLASAEKLNELVHRYFPEKQTYRIDHYLGKETVQNLLVFRFANMFIESLWNRQGVDHVEITAAEKLGVEGRAAYYEPTGALRDMVQNHITQLLTLVAMEPPATRDEDAIRNEKVKVLRSIAPLGPDDIVRGQYAVGQVDGKDVPGYRQEPGISPNSETETFVALRMRINNWRWQDVPFYVRTGKRLPTRSSRVVVTFRAPPVSFFQTEEEYRASPDRLTIVLQPNEGFELGFEVKVPGREIRVQTHRMRFQYTDVFGPLPDGYETLLFDVMLGDATLFVRADEVEASWRLYAPLLEQPPPVLPYPAGTWGPAEPDGSGPRWGHTWHLE